MAAAKEIVPTGLFTWCDATARNGPRAEQIQIQKNLEGALRVAWRRSESAKWTRFHGSVTVAKGYDETDEEAMICLRFKWNGEDKHAVSVILCRMDGAGPGAPGRIWETMNGTRRMVHVESKPNDNETNELSCDKRWLSPATGLAPLDSPWTEQVLQCSRTLRMVLDGSVKCPIQIKLDGCVVMMTPQGLGCSIRTPPLPGRGAGTVPPSVDIWESSSRCGLQAVGAGALGPGWLLDHIDQQAHEGCRHRGECLASGPSGGLRAHGGCSGTLLPERPTHAAAATEVSAGTVESARAPGPEVNGKAAAAEVRARASNAGSEPAATEVFANTVEFCDALFLVERASSVLGTVFLEGMRAQPCAWQYALKEWYDTRAAPALQSAIEGASTGPPLRCASVGGGVSLTAVQEPQEKVEEPQEQPQEQGGGVASKDVDMTHAENSSEEENAENGKTKWECV